MKPSRFATRPIGCAAPLAALALSVFQPSPALASPNGFRVETGPDQFFAVTGAVDQTSSNAVSATGVMNGLQGAVGTANFSVAAGPGIARASMDAAYSAQPAWGFNAHATAVSTTDLRIDGPSGVVPINTSINLHIDGTITIPNCGSAPGTLCDITVFLKGPSQRNLEVSVISGINQSNANFPGLAVDDMPGGRRVHGDVAVPIDVMSNTPFTITLAVTLGGRGSVIGTYRGDYYTPGNQISFSPTGLLFNNIPAGYTVSGEEVVDNRWHNPFAPATTVTVADCNDPALASLTTVEGNLIIRNLPLCTQIALPNLVSIGGDLIVRGNQNATVINLSSLTTVTGSVDVTDNTGATVIDLGSLTTVGGSIDLGGNTSAGSVDVGSLAQAGSIAIADNGDGVVNLSSVTTVSGSVDVEDNSSSGVFDLGADGMAAGSIDLDSNSSQVTGSTALGSTDVAITRGPATMDVLIPAGSFPRPVSFTITPIVADPPAAGTAADGAAATITPTTSFQFVFAVPTLNLDASLAFTIDLVALGPADTANILNAIGSGTASIIGKSDAAGASYTAFPICIGAQTPAVNRCAAVSFLDTNHQPTTGQPMFVRFDGVVGHFSSYGVGIVTKIVVDTQPPVITRSVAADSCSLPGDNGWCRGTQTAGFSASDAGSAIGAPCAASAGVSCAFTRTAAVNGASMSIASGAVCDALNNCNPGIAAGPFKIDSIVPMLAPSINSQSVQQGMLATASANAIDATSGIASSSCDPVDTSTVGQHTIQCRARDNAGNTNTASLMYTVVAQTPSDGHGRCGKGDDDDHDGHHGRGGHDNDHDNHDHHGQMPDWWPRGRLEHSQRFDDRFGGR